MNCTEYFNAFQPRDVTLVGVDSSGLAAAFAARPFLVLGEVHGVRDNSAVLLTLVRALGCDSLCVESWEAWAGPLVRKACKGQLRETDLSRLPAAGVICIEYLKTVALLHADDNIRSVYYIESPGRSDVEAGLADGLLSVPTNARAIAELGNWHTTSKPEENHVSALELLRRVYPTIPYIQVRYRQSAILNVGVGLDYVDDELAVGDPWHVKRVGEFDFELIVENSPSIILPIPESIQNTRDLT